MRFFLRLYLHNGHILDHFVAKILPQTLHCASLFKTLVKLCPAIFFAEHSGLQHSRFKSSVKNSFRQILQCFFIIVSHC